MASLPLSFLGAINFSSAACWKQHLQLLSWAAESSQTSSGHEWKTFLPAEPTLSSARQAPQRSRDLQFINMNQMIRFPQYLENSPSVQLCSCISEGPAESLHRSMGRSQRNPWKKIRQMVKTLDLFFSRVRVVIPRLKMHRDGVCKVGRGVKRSC